MNSIRRGRRRPRVDSFSFESFFWVLTREAFVALVQFREGGDSQVLALRRWLVTVPTHRVRALAENILVRHPDWRVK